MLFSRLCFLHPIRREDNVEGMGNPILGLELRLSGRRRRAAVGRASLVLLLAAEAFGFAWLWAHAREAALEAGAIAEAFVRLLLAQVFLTVLVAAPARYAGALASEKAQGTLPLLLTTQLTAWQIVSGKLAARAPPVFAAALLGLPFLVLVGLPTGAATVELLWGATAAAAALLFALASWCLWVSLRSDHARNAALFLYVTLGAALVGGVIVEKWGLPWASARYAASRSVRPWLQAARGLLDVCDPLALVDCAVTRPNPAEFRSRLATFVALCTTVGAFFLALTVWRLRAETMRSLERQASLQFRLALRSPRRQAVHEEDPVAWREQILGAGWGRWAWAAALGPLTIWGTWKLAEHGKAWPFALLWAVGGLLGGLLVAVRAAGAVSGERDRQTWDSLLLTPLDTWEILIDKRRGVVWSFWPVFVAFLPPALLLPWFADWRAGVVALGFGLFCSGMVLYLASVGIQRSAESRGGWLAPAAALLRGYGFVLGVLLLSGAAACLGFCCITLPFVKLVMEVIGVMDFLEQRWPILTAGFGALLGWKLYHSGNERLWRAQTWIDAHERYGRTVTRSLALALRKHYERLEEKRRRGEAQQHEPLKPAAVPHPVKP